MIVLKLVGGCLLLLIAVFMILFTMRSQKKECNMDESIHRSIGIQGYIFTATLIMIGLFLIITGIEEINTKKENKTKTTDRVVLHNEE